MTVEDHRRSPEQTIAQFLEQTVPPGAFLTGAVVVASYVIPGEDDDDERGPFLAWACDGEAGRWVHLGMCEAVSNDMRSDLRAREGDE